MSNAAPTDTLMVIDAEKRSTITTLQVIDGNIIPASGTLDEPAICCIAKQGRPGWIRVFVLESGTVNLHVDLDLIYLMQIGGTPVNDDLMTMLSVQNMDIDVNTYFKKMYKVVNQIVSRHPAHPISPYLIRQCQMTFTPTETIGLIEKLSPEFQASLKMQRLKENLQLAQDTEEGKMFKELTGESPDGKSTALSEYVGKGNYVLADFWASWCEPCIAEMPNVIALYEKYKDRGLNVIGITVRDAPEKSDSIVRQMGIPFPQIYESKPMSIYGVTGIPHSILFAPDGTILSRRIVSSKELDKKLETIFNDKYTISGNFTMLINEGVKVYDVEIHNDSTMILPAGQQIKKYEVKDGKFQISGRIEKPLYSELMVKQDMKFKNGETRIGSHTIPFILETGNIVMDDEQLLFRGTPLNDVCFEAMLKYRELLESNQYDELKRYVKDFVNQHRDDQAAILMIDLARDLLQPQEILTMINQCSEDIQRSCYIALLKFRLIEECKGPQEGDKFVDFSVEYNGKTTRLSDYVGRGKYVLVDFWASWCGPCRQEIPNLITTYEKYKDRGLQVIGIAAWDKPEDTLRAIEEEKMPYPQIINSQKIATDIYGINGIPEIILFAPDGTILARGLRGNEIEKKLAEIFE